MNRAAAGRTMLLALALALPSAACRHSHVSGTASTDAVLDTFNASGFDVASMKVVEPGVWVADHCEQGTVAQLDVVLCEYKTEQAMASGEDEIRKGWDVVNVDTGVVVHNGRTIMAIADRAKHDPEGRVIARLLNAFRALP